MGNYVSLKNNEEKTTERKKENKNHYKAKSFRIGLSFGKGTACVQKVGYASNTKKQYEPNPFEKSWGAFVKNSFAKGQNNLSAESCVVEEETNLNTEKTNVE